MKLKMVETDNGFREDLFDKMCEVLESGEGIWLYCWCTGHTRCEMVKYEYERKLVEKYGDKLKEAKDEDGWTEGFVLER